MFETIKKFLQELRQEFLTYPLDKKFYLAGNFVLWYVFLPVIAGIWIFWKKAFPEQEMLVTAYFVGSIFCIGVCIEAWKVGVTWFGKAYIKWFVGGVSLLVYKFSVIQSDKFINMLTGLEPAFLPSASSSLSIFYLLYYWLLVMIIVLSIILLLATMLLLFSSIRKFKLSEIFGLARILGILPILSVLSYSASIFENPSPSSFVAKISKEIILDTEYFSNSYCKGLGNDLPPKELPSLG